MCVRVWAGKNRVNARSFHQLYGTHMYIAVASRVSCSLLVYEKCATTQIFDSMPERERCTLFSSLYFDANAASDVFCFSLSIWLDIMYIYSLCACDLFDDGAFAIYPDISTISHFSVLSLFFIRTYRLTIHHSLSLSCSLEPYMTLSLVCLFSHTRAHTE